MIFNENYEISRENSDSAHDFHEYISVKMDASRYCTQLQKMGSSWKHLVEINLDQQYEGSIPVSFWAPGKNNQIALYWSWTYRLCDL